MLFRCTESSASPLDVEVNFVKALCETIGSVRSLTVWLLLEYKEFEQLIGLSIDPSRYDNPSNFADDHLVTEVLKKSPNLPLTIDRRDAAVESFWLSELGCLETNYRLKNETFDLERKFQIEISKLLGPVDKSALIEIDRMMRHGPGATASLRGRGLVPSDKFEKSISLTIDLYPFYKSILGANWHNSQRSPAEIVGGNKFTTVPKSAKTDRGIAAEPTLNMYVQLGIGSYLRRRLKRFGIDLNDQVANQELAQRAYFDGLATIDLSSASDSICYQLIVRYFPEDWVELLTLPRSHRTYIDGTWHELEKFSSMGNGYTFELESLIFLALCRCIVPEKEYSDVGVYGDDIIIPAKYADQLVDTLKFLGFRVNKSKSFLAGNFFESCGSDFFKGVNVRPFYLRGSKGDIPYTVQIANKLRLYAWMRMKKFGCDSRFRQLWVDTYHLTPKFWRKAKVPPQFGDTGLITSFREAKPKKNDHGIEGYTVRHVTFEPSYRKRGSFDRRIKIVNHSVLLSQLPRGVPPIEIEDSGHDVILHDSNIFSSLWALRTRVGTSALVNFIRREIEATDSLPTYGKEPRRGYLGMVRTSSTTVLQWCDGLEWT